jgi:hypothetical protein
MMSNTKKEKNGSEELLKKDNNQSLPGETLVKNRTQDIDEEFIIEFVSEENLEKEEPYMDIFDNPSIWKLQHHEGSFDEISPDFHLPRTHRAFQSAILHLTELKMDSKTSIGDINEVSYHQTDIKSVTSDDGTSEKTMNNFDCQAKHISSSFHMEDNHGKTCVVCDKGELICTSNPLRDCKVDVLLASIINDGIGDMIWKHSKFKFPITRTIISI